MATFPCATSRDKQANQVAPPASIDPCLLALRLACYHKSDLSHHTRFSTPTLVPRKFRTSPAICTHSCLEATQSPGFLRKPFKLHPGNWPHQIRTSEICQINL